MTDVPLKPIVELAFGANLNGDPDDWVWTDVSAEARRVPPTITRGRSDEASSVSPASATVVLSNQDGEFTPHNAMSPHWPHVKLGTPMRISVEVDEVPHIRFVGHVAGWEPFWPFATPKEGDSEGVAHIRVTAAGVLRRLTQGQKPLQSPLFRRVTSDQFTSNVFGYWPLEDQGDGFRASTPLTGVRSMLFGGDFNFGGDDTLPGSQPVVHIPGGRPAGWQGHLPLSTGSTWRLDFLFRLPEALPAGHFPLMGVHSTGTTRFWELNISAFGDLNVVGRSASGAVQFTNSIIGEHFGPWNHLSLTVWQGGNRVNRLMTVAPIGTFPATVSGQSTGHRIGRPTSVANLFVEAPPEGYSFGHISMSRSVPTFWLGDAPIGYRGEPAAERVERLCNEEDVPVLIVGDAAASEPMGIQRPLPLVPLLEECAAAGGILSESVDTAALRFRTTGSLWNQDPAVIADVVERGLDEPFGPVEDDRALRNDITASTPDGATVRVEDETHVRAEGRYDTSVDLNVATERRLSQHAGWQLHIGTLPEMRYSQLSAKLRTAGQTDDWVEVDLGDRVQGVNLPRQHPSDVDVLIEGWSETLTGFAWLVTANCSPASPYSVGVLDGDGTPDVTLPRLDTDGSELTAGVDETETGSWSIEVTDGPLWTTDADYFPLDIELGGETVTLSGISGNGTADVAHGLGDASATASTSHVAPSLVAAGDADLLICAWCSFDDTGTYTVPGSMGAGAETSGTLGTMRTAGQILASDGATGTRTATFSVSDSWAAVSVLVHRALPFSPVIEESFDAAATGVTVPDITFNTDASTEAGWLLLAIHAWSHDPAAIMGAPSGDGWVPVADSAGLGNVAHVRAWAKRVTEPGVNEVVFTGPTTIGSALDQHARLFVLSGATSAVQTFEVAARSVNGVVKAHPAGTAIEVANPIRLSL